MNYRIIIAKNGRKKKILHQSNDIKYIKRKYFTLKDKNKILFPVKTNAYKKITPVKYEIILIKKYEEGDTSFIDRDSLGRTFEINVTNNEWTILYKDIYYYEETFTVFNSIRKLSAIEIIKTILMKKHKGITIKQVNYLHNKLLIHQNNDFDIIVCKCPDDAQRLYKLLEIFCINNKIKNIMFTDKVGILNKTDTYKMIVEKTGWSKNKTYRTVTRP
jgi:hypothetical protein